METMKFMIGGKEAELTLHEMKTISDKYWEHWGKDSMLAYAEKMIHKANSNIRDALAMHSTIKDEDDVKVAIAHALDISAHCGDWDLLAEVLYESAERAAACFSYKSITEED